MSQRIIVIGAVNMDLTGTPLVKLRGGDSNPGRVQFSHGGVGRNIAENLCRLGRPVSLITMMGDDSFAESISKGCREIGMDLSMCLRDPESRTSTYLCVTEQNGDLHTAVSDMEIYDRLTPEKLEPFLPALNEAALVIVDANLPKETIGWIGREVTAPIAADPVSVAKVGRLRGILERLEMMKPNVPEAELLTGVQVRNDADFARIAGVLLGFGVRRVFLSLGDRGVYYSDGRDSGHLPCFAGPVVNTTGCGDAFLAAAADAWLDGLGIRGCALRALAAAAHCAADLNSVSTTLNKEVLLSQLGGFPIAPQTPFGPHINKQK